MFDFKTFDKLLIQLYLFLSWNEQRISAFFFAKSESSIREAVESVTLQVLDLVRLEFVEEAGWRRLWVSLLRSVELRKSWSLKIMGWNFTIFHPFCQRNLLIQWSQCQHLEFRARHSYIYIYNYTCRQACEVLYFQFFLCFMSTALMASYSCLRVEVNALKTMTDRAQEELVEDPSPFQQLVTVGWDHWIKFQSSDKFTYPLVVIDVDGLTD